MDYVLIKPWISWLMDYLLVNGLPPYLDMASDLIIIGLHSHFGLGFILIGLWITQSFWLGFPITLWSPWSFCGRVSMEDFPFLTVYCSGFRTAHNSVRREMIWRFDIECANDIFWFSSAKMMKMTEEMISKMIGRTKSLAHRSIKTRKADESLRRMIVGCLCLSCCCHCPCLSCSSASLSVCADLWLDVGLRVGYCSIIVILYVCVCVCLSVWLS